MTTPSYTPMPPGYVRHRPRYVAQSVYVDLRRTLAQTGWLVDPDEPAQFPPPKGLIGKNPLVVIDAFPDSTQGEEVVLNTLAMDKGIQGDLEEYQMGGGSPSHSQEYAFHMAFYANSDATAQALFQDLSDRYLGLTDSPFISLYNYAVSATDVVVRMEVDTFAFSKATETVAVHEQNLHFGRLLITDYLDETVRVLT